MEIEKHRVYEVHHTNAERREAWLRVVFRIMVTENPSCFDCECGLYKHFGILCCHAIAIIVYLGVTKIPDAHVLKRWTSDVRDVLPAHLAMYQKDTPAMHSKMFRHRLLHVNAMELVKLGDTNLDTFKELMRVFAAGQKAVKSIIAAIGEPVVDPFPNYESSDAEWHRERTVECQSEPDPSRTDGVQFGLSGARNTCPPSGRPQLQGREGDHDRTGSFHHLSQRGIRGIP